MIKILMIGIALTFVGCSSAKKSDTTTVTQPKIVGKPTAGKTTPVKPPAGKPVQVSNSDNQVTCTLGEESRTIEVITDDAGCKTLYTKGGEPKEMANGAASGTYCQSVLEKIKGNLESSGYTCN